MVKPPREARKGGVWIVETKPLKADYTWSPVEFHPTEASANESADSGNRRSRSWEYRAVHYVPANPRRSTRRKK